jgi:HEAT repeat protein
MRARRAAIRSLSRLTSDRRARESLEDLLEDQDPLVRSDVVSSLGEMNDSKSRGPLQRALDHETDGRVARRIRDVLRDLGSSSARAEQQRLSDEVETLKNELGELRSRLSRIEAK